MLSSGSLAHPSRKMHSMKRRKLAHAPPPTLQDATVKPHPLVLSTSASANHPKVVPVCASCHRASFGTKQSQLVDCARCHAVTCVICSRICNGCPSSLPPISTPAPNAVVRPTMPLTAWRRPALALHTNTALGVTPLPIAGRRRKMRDRDGAEEEAGGCERLGNGERDSDKDSVLPGCERTVCRDCAFEIPDRELTTCYDCAARVMGPTLNHP